MAIQQIAQTVAGSGTEPIHTHPPQVHAHDHYHVALVHESKTGMWDHETTWHSHEHNHNATTHSHDFARAEEEQRHGSRAHIHDHASPALRLPD
jgi:hypothetical protein